MCGCDDVCSVRCRGAELGFGALDAIVRLGLLPIVAVAEKRSWPGLPVRTLGLVRSSRNGLDRGAHRRGYSDGIGIVAGTAFNAIPGRQERVEALNEGGVASKKLGDAVDYAWRVNAGGE